MSAKPASASTAAGRTADEETAREMSAAARKNIPTDATARKPNEPRTPRTSAATIRSAPMNENTTAESGASRTRRVCPADPSMQMIELPSAVLIADTHLGDIAFAGLGRYRGPPGENGRRFSGAGRRRGARAVRPPSVEPLIRG